MSLSFWQVTEGHPTGKQRRECGSFTEVVEKVLGSISFSQASTSPFDYAAEDSESTLAGLTSEKCVSINIKEPGLLFTPRFAEGVIRLTDLNVYEPGI